MPDMNKRNKKNKPSSNKVKLQDQKKNLVLPGKFSGRQIIIVLSTEQVARYRSCGDHAISRISP